MVTKETVTSPSTTAFHHADFISPYLHFHYHTGSGPPSSPGWRWMKHKPPHLQTCLFSSEGSLFIVTSTSKSGRTTTRGDVQFHQESMRLRYFIQCPVLLGFRPGKSLTNFWRDLNGGKQAWHGFKQFTLFQFTRAQTQTGVDNTRDVHGPCTAWRQHAQLGRGTTCLGTHAGVLGICLGLEKGEMALSGLEFAPGHIFMAALIAGYEFLGLAEAPAVILLQSRSGLE